MVSKMLVPQPPYQLQNVVVFRPSFQEFKSMADFIESPKVQSAGAHGGIVKVVTPVEWDPTDDSLIKHGRSTRGSVLHDLVTGLTVIHQKFNPVLPHSDKVFVYEREHKGIRSGYEWTQHAHESEVLAYQDWEKVRKGVKRSKVAINQEDIIADRYWGTRSFQTAHYAADISGTLMKKELQHWNFGGDFSPCLTTQLKGIMIDGVTTPYLYIGAAGTTFGFHTEDADLYSLNYMHEAAGENSYKHWYAIPSSYGVAFECLVKELCAGYVKDCDAFMREKSFVIHPSLILERGIPVFQARQNPGDLIITFPYAYHSGFNAGFNIAEARNIALESWLPYGLSSKHCSCNTCPPDPFPLEYVERIAKEVKSSHLKKYKQMRRLGLSFSHPGQIG